MSGVCIRVSFCWNIARVAVRASQRASHVHVSMWVVSPHSGVVTSDSRRKNETCEKMARGTAVLTHWAFAQGD
jgi:hypothetical protein